jgi:predicted Zn-dependent peptidase
LSSELDAMGADYNAFTSKEYTGYYIKSTKDKIKVSLDILSDMLLNSKFDSQEIEKEKGVIIEELNMYEDNPRIKIEDVFENCLYGDTPAGWDTIGNKETIRNFKRSDFIKYFSNQYGIKNMAVFVAGNFSDKEIKKMLAKNFSLFKKNNYRDKLKVVEKQIKPNLLIKNKKTDQTVLSLGFRAFPANHPDEYILKLLAVILGGSMSSRLFTEIRERRGLAYFIRSSIETYTDSGYISSQAGVPNDKLKEVVKAILNCHQELKNNLVGTEELQKAKDLISGKTIVQMEGSDDFSSWYAYQFIKNRKKFLSPEESLNKIKKVTAKDIRRVAQKVFINKNLNLAIIGNVKNKEVVKNILKID